jgi:hypothetical protein
MKVNDLRIGNYVYSEIFDMTIKVEGIIFGGAIQFHRKEYDYIEQVFSFEPIPLAEEWLLRLGFTLDHEQQSFCHRTFVLNDFELIEEMDGRYTYNNIEIKYVHKLQNLYFALTGEELAA